jgi:hypothetical protein
VHRDHGFARTEDAVAFVSGEQGDQLRRSAMTTLLQRPAPLAHDTVANRARAVARSNDFAPLRHLQFVAEVMDDDRPALHEFDDHAARISSASAASLTGSLSVRKPSGPPLATTKYQTRLPF